MTNREYLRKMNALSRELERLGNARPYDPVRYNNVVDTLNMLNSRHRACRRFRRWHFIIKLISLAFLLAFVVLSITC